LFAFNAFLTVLGTFLYSTFLNKLDKSWMIIITIFLAGAVLLLATQVFYINQLLFFVLLLVAEAVFIIQLKIFLDGYVEEIFTPLASERTFPIIEAAETVGGIAAGVVIMLFASQIEIFKFVYLWAILLFLMVPFVLFISNLNKKIVIEKEVETNESDSNENGLIALIKREFISTEKGSFLKGMFILVFFQWLLYNLLEFQYTKAIYNNVSHVILDGGGGFEHAFVHDLGALFVLFSVSALVIQLFMGSRFIDSLGVVGSMLIHPIVTLLSLLGMIFSFNFYTAVLAKNNFTLTTAVFTNAYHSTYYAIQEKSREYSREFMEGIVRPAGALTGTIILILFQYVLSAKGMIFAVNILMPLIAAAFLYVVFRQRRRYTKTAVSSLLNSVEKDERVNAIDILAQKGHFDATKILLGVLNDEDESISLRVKALKALAENQDKFAVKDIINCFTSSSAAIREAALDALFSYKDLARNSKHNAILKYELVEALKKMYEIETHDEIRRAIISLLSKLSNVATIEFLLNILQKEECSLRADAVYALGNCQDVEVVRLVRPYLDSGDKEKVNAAISLGRFDEFKDEACYIASSFIFSEDELQVAYGLFAAGEMNLKQFKKRCLSYLSSNNENLRMHAALALAKMKSDEAIPVLVDLLLNGSYELSKRLKKNLKNVDVRIYKNIDRIVRYMVPHKIKKIIQVDVLDSLMDLDRDSLVLLKRLYCLVEDYDEVEKIDKLI